MKTNNLKPCPFCGRNDLLIFEPLPGCTDVGNVACACGASYTTITQGVDDWNTRPIEDGLQAKVVALQKELDELKERYRWHNIEVDGLPELDQDVELFDVTGAFVKEVMAGHFFDYEEGNDTSPDIRFIDHADDDWFTLDELENNYQWRYLNAPKEGE